MCQISVVTTQSTLKETPSFSKINTASQMITSISATWIGLYNAQIWHIYFPNPPPCKGNISAALELAIVTYKVSL